MCAEKLSSTSVRAQSNERHHVQHSETPGTAPPPAILDSDLGRAVIEAATGLDALAARGILQRRYPAAADELIRAATVQAELAARAEHRFGPLGREFLWTSSGLEQASRPATSHYRAATLRAAGIRSVADLTCGLGMDALAFAQAGMSVVAVEQDPTTASLAAANTCHAAAGRSVEVILGSCTDPAVLDLASEADAWFVDPSRRSEQRHPDGRHLRLDDPQQWSPPWAWVLAQAQRVGAAPASPRVLMVKAAPGLPHEEITDVPGCQVDAEWLSQGGQLLETCVSWWRADVAVAAPSRRAAVILDEDGRALVRIVADSVPPPATAHPPLSGEYLFDPDPAIVRSGVVTEFATAAGARLVDSHLAYLASSEPMSPALTPAARSWQVLDSGTYDPRRLRAACAEHGIGHLEVTGRGRRLDPTRVRRELRLPGSGARGVLVVMSLGPTRTTYVCLCRPV